MCRKTAHLTVTLVYKNRKLEEDNSMKAETTVQKAFYSGGEPENCYLFSPSLSKRRDIGGKSYYVRRYFKGGKDFEKTMETLAVQHTVQKVG